MLILVFELREADEEVVEEELDFLLLPFDRRVEEEEDWDRVDVEFLARLFLDISVLVVVLVVVEVEESRLYLVEEDFLLPDDDLLWPVVDFRGDFLLS